MIDEIIKNVRPKMKDAIEHLESGLSKVRTGRAHAEIVDSVKASYYGALTPIKEMASVTVPESNVIAIKPWDRNALADIETAVKNSDLGLSPINDGTMVRLVLPPMTEERRKELVLQVKKMGEEAKVTLRNIRGEAWAQIQAAEKKNEATEDDRYRAEEELNKLIAEFNKEVDAVLSEKEKEVMKI